MTELQHSWDIKLEPQYLKFAEAYMRLFNERKAAIEAGYSEKSAHVTGCRILKNANVQSYIQARMREAAMDTTEVLYHLAQIVRGDMDDVVDSKGAIDLYSAREFGKTNLIKRIKTKTITTANDKDGEGSDIFESETEMYDRMKAMELIGKHLGMWTERVEAVTPESKMIDAIRNREAWATWETVVNIYDGDENLAEKLFKQAGVPIER
jgi:phage terminase small subunit